MWTRQKRKSIIGRFCLPLLTIAFLSYFGFHAYNGEYGIYSSKKLAAQIAELQIKRDELVQRRTIFEQEVSLLRDGTIERDMLDEQARRALNLSKTNELTIFIK